MLVGRSERLRGIDLARCLALISMYVAHVAPSPGPMGVLNLTEFMTAALFAMLIGVSADLSRRSMNFPALFASSVVRGIGLVALGLWLDIWLAQVDIVLAYLGVLSVVTAVLVYLPTWCNLLIGVLTWWLTPWAISYFDPLHQQLTAEGSLLRYLTLWMFSGENYRVFTMIAWAALGILVIRLLQKGAVAVEIAGALIMTAAAAALWYYAQSVMEFLPYTGYHAEVAFDALLACAAIFWCSLLARIFSTRESVLALPVTVGRMTLSLYTLQIGILALYSRYAPSYNLPYRDDSWAMLAILVGASFLFAWCWNKALGRTFAYRGPLETVLALTSGRG